jgi:hypothetical protein
MRIFAQLLVVVAASLSVAASPVAVDRDYSSTNLEGGLGFRIPPGWHLLHGWLSDVVFPVPRLAIASFPAKLSRHTCECGSPNIVHFPRTGAFLFVWERPHYPRWALTRIPLHAAHYWVAQHNPRRFTCAGPSWQTAFRESDAVFQIEVYLGPAAGPKVRGKLNAILDGFRLTPPSRVHRARHR